MGEYDSNMDVLIGNWESICLNPTVMIYSDRQSYKLCILYMNEDNGQASPATYRIEKDEDGFYIYFDFKRHTISYELNTDILWISSLGNYQRN